jgi:hypothetical protein
MRTFRTYVIVTVVTAAANVYAAITDAQQYGGGPDLSCCSSGRLPRACGRGCSTTSHFQVHTLPRPLTSLTLSIRHHRHAVKSMQTMDTPDLAPALQYANASC